MNVPSNKAREKALAIGKLLDELFPDPQIPLQHTDPFTLLVAVVLSAQCKDERVNVITPHLFAQASTPQLMASMPIPAIEALIRPCGLGPQKARALSRLAQLICNQHKGQVPANFPELESLPGVGHKTASVVMMQAFGEPTFPVDTHIHRLAARWGLSSGKSVEQTERDLKALFPQDQWARLHLQLILCGRSYCPARGHQAATCKFCGRFGLPAV